MSTIPGFLHAMVDDAAIFPPGNAPLTQALAAHREHVASAYADLVGPFVVSDVRLPELVEILRQDPTEQEESLLVSVVVTGGAGAIEPAVRWATRSPRLALRSVEFALRDEDDLAHNARRVIAAMDQLAASGQVDDDLAVYVEPPPLPDASPRASWLAALDEVAASDYRLKFRTGGADESAFPGCDALAVCIQQALDRELAFKCTAGLHHALRHRDADTGLLHHGFLNVLLATRASLDGAHGDHLAEVLAETDVDAVRRDLADQAALESARRWFRSFGSCSVLEPLEDLVDLDLVPNLPLERV